MPFILWDNAFDIFSPNSKAAGQFSIQYPLNSIPLSGCLSKELPYSSIPADANIPVSLSIATPIPPAPLLSTKEPALPTLSHGHNI